MTWKLLLLAACSVIGIAVAKSLGYGKPEPTTVEHLREWAKREEQRRRNALAANDQAA